MQIWEAMEEVDQALKSLTLDSNCESASSSCVILGNLPNFSDPQFSHLWKEDSNTHFKRFLWELAETPAQCAQLMAGTSVMPSKHALAAEREHEDSWASCSWEPEQPGVSLEFLILFILPSLTFTLKPFHSSSLALRVGRPFTWKLRLSAQ